MSQKKRHHYIPKFYLEGFVDQNNRPYVWIYEKGNTNIGRAAPKDIAVQKDYYSFIDFSGRKDRESIEDIFWKLERRIAPIFKTIKAKQKLSDLEKRLFSDFLAFSMTRVPNYRDNIERAMAESMKKMGKIYASHSENCKAFIQRFEEETGSKIPFSVEELRRSFLDGQYDSKLPPESSLEFMPIALKLAPIFFEMNWTFLEAPDDFQFVTCDNPVFYCDPSLRSEIPGSVGLANENVEVTFPISKDFLLLCTWHDFVGYNKSTRNFAKDVTRRTAMSALRFIFGSQKSQALNRLVQKYKDSAPRIVVE